jgi:alpha-tubulin suppressor-like RCC1 family protein
MQKFVCCLLGGIAILITSTLHGAVPQIAAGAYHSLALNERGEVRAFGRNSGGQCDVASWTDIVQIAAGSNHSVGLKSDGTVVAVGQNGQGQCDVGSWTDIVEVMAGGSHTLGRRPDGTVLAVGNNNAGQCDVGSWTDIVQLAAGSNHSLGLTASLQVVATGDNSAGQCNVGGWADVQFVSAGSFHSLGVKLDGTVIATGDNADGQCGVEGWAGIEQVAGGRKYSLGLKSDGSVVAVGGNASGQCDVDGWTNIVQVAAFFAHSVGLKENGQPEAVGWNIDGQCDFGRWTGFQKPVALEILEEISTSEWVQHSDVSADGAAIIGSHSPGDGWRWEDDSAVILTGLYSARSISYDGSIVVGFSEDGPNDKKAVVWRDGLIEEYPNLPASPTHVSGDGNVIMGEDADNLGIIFRWKDGELTHLGRGYFAEGEPASQDLSEDGSILIATSRKWVTGELRATIWVDGVMQDLGTLPGDDESTAMAISADGTMIVGSSINSLTDRQRPCY